MHVSASTVSGFNLHRRSSRILPVVLKVDSEEIIETDTLKISLARVERIR